MVKRIFMLIGLLLVLVSCGVPWTEADMRSTAEGQMLLKAFDDLRLGRSENLASQFSSEITSDAGYAQAIQKMIAEVPKGEIKSAEFLGWHMSTTTTNGRTSDVTAQFEFPGSWLLVQMAFRGEPESLIVTGFNVQRMSGSYQDLTAFTFSGKTAKHYAFATLAIVSALTCVWAFIACLRTPRFPRKWIWALFTLTGFVTVTMNWTTGAFSIAPLMFTLLGASLVKDAATGIWMLSLSIPVGAIAFFFKRRRLKEDGIIPDSSFV